ncbi:MAG: DUF7948 domain-containing protein, partial [Methylosarcina sp.]
MNSRMPFSNQLAVVAALVFTPIGYAAVSQPQAPNRPQVDPSFGQRPLSFEANQGQTDSTVKFLSRGPGYSLHLTSAEAVLTLRRSGSPSATQPGKGGSIKPQTSSSAVLRMQLQGANPKAAVLGFDELPGKVNYLHGKEAKAWRTGIATYAKVQYTGVYPGIDLVYYGNQRQLEYDFVVAPGADPKAIRMNFEGAEKLALDAEGKLIVKTAGGDVIQHKPVVYQEINGVRQDIAGNYVLYPAAEGKAPQVGFQLAQYDSSHPLTIDPVMVYAIYLGGTGDDAAGPIAVDRWGNIYVTGSTDSTDFPIARAFQKTLVVSSDEYGFPYRDAFITKLNPKGAVVYSTYFGGTGNEGGNSIAVDPSGNAYVTGNTTSTDFPTKKPLQATLKGTSNAFVAKLNPVGSLVYSTYLGGSTSESGNAITVDRSGNAYVTGQTSSTDFPTVHALQNALIGTSDAFIAKLNPVGSALVYATYLGGNGSDDIYSGDRDSGAGIAVDNFGSAYITGVTNSTDFPTMKPLQPDYGGTSGAPSNYLPYEDAFVVKLNPAGSALVYSTYLGGDSGDEGRSIAVDGLGNVYVTGWTWSTNFPTVQPWQEALAGG